MDSRGTPYQSVPIRTISSRETAEPYIYILNPAIFIIFSKFCRIFDFCPCISHLQMILYTNRNIWSIFYGYRYIDQR